MSERVRIGGQRRIDRILDPAFLERMTDLPTEELRARRDECRAELEYLSYFRRLIQVRQDILAAERERRASGEKTPVVDKLAEILSEQGGGGAGGRGQYLSLGIPDEEIQLARRGAEALVADANLSDLAAFDEAGLDETIEKLSATERDVSEDRRQVITVHDALQDELKQRYRADLSQVPSEPR